MKRRIIRQGNSAFTITLPKKWVDRLGLAPGDEIDVSDEGTGLLIRSQAMPQQTRAELDLRKMSDTMIKAHITSAYISGADEVSARIESDKIQIVQETIQALIGFAVVKQRPEEILIKHISGEPADNKDILMRRIFFMIVSNAEDFYNSLESGRTESIADIGQRDRNVNMFVSFCLRNIVKSKDYRNSVFRFHILVMLELLSDELANMWKLCAEFKVPPDNAMKEILRETVDMLNSLHRCFYSYDVALSNSLTEKRDRIRKMIAKVKARDYAPQKYLYHINKTAEFVINILQTRLVMEMDMIKSVEPE